jgi:hypothetical protein|tara:strand:+ start:427 stop:549 length:123 start_codon:yes stop_codon:yes gene_type:complete
MEKISNTDEDKEFMENTEEGKAIDAIKEKLNEIIDWINAQ